MADDTYRKFHSGRFGPEGTINPDFATKVESGGSFQNQKTGPQTSTGKDKAGNTYSSQKTADEFDSQDEFMKD